MFFKSLQLYGFKSFVKRTKIAFQPGVTTIVGPNGCGKSNISDAIRWVLGEQSARVLRGTQMEDIIFNGSEHFEPIGYAEVTLVISNEGNILPLEFEEIGITRRLYRSGESEYFINNVPVRLKDINELLMDTGMGVGGYFLMEQGKVDRVLNSKPEDRRSIFEEASGITKYKYKKDESLRKLESTESNLVRINDIISEIRRQIKSIERQVNKAERYRHRFERLKGLEVKLGCRDYRRLENKLKNLESAMADLKREAQNQDGDYHQQQKQGENLAQQLSVLDTNLAASHTESVRLESKVQQDLHQIKLDAERAEELKQREKKLTAEIESAQRHQESIRRKISDLREKQKLLQEKNTSFTELKDKKNAEINELSQNVETAKEEISQRKGDILEYNAESAKLRTDLNRLTSNLSVVRARLKRLNLEKERTQAEIKQSEAILQKFNKERDCLQCSQGELNARKKALDDKLKETESVLQRINQRHNDIQKENVALESKINFLKESMQRFEGFSEGTKWILKQIKDNALNIAGVHGALSDLVGVKAGYELAGERALLPHLQTIIVDTETTARELISRLNQQQAGMVSFICLDKIPAVKPRRISRAANKMNLENLRKFVDSDAAYARCLDYLLNDYFLLEASEDASEAFRSLDPQAKLVTKKGDFIAYPFISGGSMPQGSESLIIGRSGRLKGLIQQHAHLKGVLGEIEKKCAELSASRHVIGEGINELAQKLDGLKIELSAKDSHLNNLSANLKKFKEEDAILDMDITESRENLNRLSAEESDLKAHLEEIETKIGNAETSISEKENSIEAWNETKQQALIALTQIETEFSTLEREEKNLTSALEIMEHNLKELDNSVLTKEQEIAADQQKTKGLENGVDNLKQQSEHSQEAKQKLQQKVAELKLKRDELREAARGMQEHLKSQQQALETSREKMHQQELQKRELLHAEDSLIQKVRTNYNLNLYECVLEPQYREVEIEESKLNEIEELKKQIQGMGQVNLGALEENKELQERYNFLIQQQQDLINAKDSLHKAILQINRTTKHLFLETFDKIQRTFREYFRMLFSGGEARLVLTDEDNVWESGVEIVARPPGKCLQNISLLSGGEKALTAIALLFATFKVKPSPFCILDEVDAPLDEANIERFNRLLNEFVKLSQFMIITHNKRTITSADVMYGITMERSGVSKIVSVKLNDSKRKEKKAEPALK